MCDPDGFEASGIVVKAVAKGRFLIEMPNGHQAFGVVQKKIKFELSELKTGDKVAVFFSPADMARATILRKMDR